MELEQSNISPVIGVSRCKVIASQPDMFVRMAASLPPDVFQRVFAGRPELMARVMENVHADIIAEMAHNNPELVRGMLFSVLEGR